MRNYEELVERVSQMKKLTLKVEQELDQDIETCLTKLAKREPEAYSLLESIDKLLSLNWKLNKNTFWLKSQVKYLAQAEGIQE